MARVLLFDIDHTLLYTGGAGSKAMNMAFEEMFGIVDGFSGIEFSGRTDISIFRDALRLHGIDGDFPTLLQRFKGVYYRYLAQTLPQTKGGLMPGVGEFLAVLGRRRDVVLGLATGNFRGGAELKLRHYGMWHHFRGGAFGDDAEERAAIVRLAVERVAGGIGGPHRVVVIGDTPHDISSAKANGALAVGVATGRHSLEELQAAGADIVLPDLSDWRDASAFFDAEA